MFKMFKSVFRRSEFMFYFIKELGGINVFINKIMGIYKSQGSSGIIRKTQYILYHSIVNNVVSQRGISETNGSYQTKKCNFKKQKEQISSFKLQPCFSIIMPTYNSNVDWLTEAIESVRNQIYTNWELCIADDASTHNKCKNLLKEYQIDDKRIKVVFRNKNGHISKASNSALEIATGEYVVLLDHDDKLSEDALFWVVETINKNPNAKLIYSDEDKFDLEGVRSDPYFKCDWNYSLFLSQNMISHLGVYKTEIIKKIGGFRPTFEGSQDYDLALRFIEHISHTQIFHIPRVLYHWRIHEDSTAFRIEEKPYALTSGRLAINQHLQRKGIHSNVEILKNQMYRVKYNQPKIQPLINIIVNAFDNHKMVIRCIKSIITKTDYSNYSIYIAHNGLINNKLKKYLKKWQQIIKVVSFVNAKNNSYPVFINKIIEQTEGSYVCLLDGNTEIINPEWLSEMISIGSQNGIGIVGARLWFPNNTLKYGGIILGIGGIASDSHKFLPKGFGGYLNRADLIQEFSAVSVSCMLISKKAFSEVKGFNNMIISTEFNGIDLCLRIREANYRIVWTPYAELYHYESISQGVDKLDGKNKRFNLDKKYMIKKWGELLKNDPAYSPNLTLDYENFSQAWPSRVESCD